MGQPTRRFHTTVEYNVTGQPLPGRNSHFNTSICPPLMFLLICIDTFYFCAEVRWYRNGKVLSMNSMVKVQMVITHEVATVSQFDWYSASDRKTISKPVIQ